MNLFKGKDYLYGMFHIVPLVGETSIFDKRRWMFILHHKTEHFLDWTLRIGFWEIAKFKKGIKNLTVQLPKKEEGK